VHTPEGIGKVMHINWESLNVFVLINKKVYGFAFLLVTPVNKAVEDILIAVHNHKEK
jgi:hypothetical protein